MKIEIFTRRCYCGYDEKVWELGARGYAAGFSLQTIAAGLPSGRNRTLNESAVINAYAYASGLGDHDIVIDSDTAEDLGFRAGIDGSGLEAALSGIAPWLHNLAASAWHRGVVSGFGWGWRHSDRWTELEAIVYFVHKVVYGGDLEDVRIWFDRGLYSVYAWDSFLGRLVVVARPVELSGLNQSVADWFVRNVSAAGIAGGLAWRN
jgi:hypothetical protein